MGLYPGAVTQWRGKRLKLMATEPLIERLRENLSDDAKALVGRGQQVSTARQSSGCKCSWCCRQQFRLSSVDPRSAIGREKQEHWKGPWSTTQCKHWRPDGLTFKTSSAAQTSAAAFSRRRLRRASIGAGSRTPSWIAAMVAASTAEIQWWCRENSRFESIDCFLT